MQSAVALVAVCSLLSLLTTSDALVYHHYVRRASTCISNASTRGFSSIQCVQTCSQTAGCRAVTVCPSNRTDQVLCQMSSDQQCQIGPSDCIIFSRQENDPLSNTTENSIRDATTSEAPTTDTVTTTTQGTPMEATTVSCEQNGRLEDGVCQCPLPYAGVSCQRVMRDCTEGAKHTSQNCGINRIQPVTSSEPFKVVCRFKDEGTMVLNRFSSSLDVWEQLTWAQAKEGLGDVTLSYFIGLDHLHEMTSQAKYKARVILMHSGSQVASVDYYNFTVGSEATSYNMSYTSYVVGNSAQIAGDGLQANFPAKFSTFDNDTGGCFSVNSDAGWFGPDCSGLSPFSSSVYWPVGSPSQRLEADPVIFLLIRESLFHDELP